MACVNNKKIEEARKQLDKIRADKELMERIRLEEAYEMDVRTAVAEAESKGRSEGEAVGFENGQMVGAAKEKKEMALKLLKLNLPIEQISEVTGLSRDEIEKMK